MMSINTESSVVSDKTGFDQPQVSDLNPSITSNDKFPAPATPQIVRLHTHLCDYDAHDQSLGSDIKDCEGKHSRTVETKHKIDFSYVISGDERGLSCRLETPENDEEVDSTNSSVLYKGNCMNHDTGKPQDNRIRSIVKKNDHVKKRSLPKVSNLKSCKRKTKIDWTPELHKRFVQAVEPLGRDQAIPSKILELMNVEGLTRHNVASHLQKYRNSWSKQDETEQRSHRHRQKDSTQMPRVVYNYKPVMAYPSLFHHVFAYPPVISLAQNYIRLQPLYPRQSWYHPLQADVWGCPILPIQSRYLSVPFQTVVKCDEVTETSWSDQSWCSIDTYPCEKVIDEAVKEVMSKPWLPLPLGLKPPSRDIVLKELQRVGVTKKSHPSSIKCDGK